jgi:hypothetical protein
MRGAPLLVLLVGCGFQIETGAGAGVDGAAMGDARGADAVDANGVVTDGPANLDAGLDAVVSACPAGYGPVNGVGRYRVVEGADKAWLDANEDCNDDDDAGFSLHTHLVVLGSEAERLLFPNASTVSGNTWIGLTDRDDEGNFHWVTTEPTGGYPQDGEEPPWAMNQPDDMNNNEDCARFKNDFKFEDKPCGDTESYVCECDAFAPLQQQ